MTQFNKVQTLGVCLFLLLLPSTLLAYQVKTTKADQDWNPKEEWSDEGNPIPIRWFEPIVQYSVSTTEAQGLEHDKLVQTVGEAMAIWIDSLRSQAIINDDKECFPDLVFSGESNNTTGGYVDGETNENTIVIIPDAEAWAERGYEANALAMTIIASNSSTGQIVDADIEINGAVFAFSDPASMDAEITKLGYTMIHEIGHMMGLGHSSVETSVMFPTTTSDQASFPRLLDNDDIEGACYLYQQIQVAEEETTVKKSGGGCDSSPGPSAPAGFGLILLAAFALYAHRRQKIA